MIDDIYGDASGLILDALRNASAPLSSSNVCEAIMSARGLDTDDEALCRLMMKRTLANVKHWSRERVLIRPMPGIGQEVLWELVR